MSRETAMTTHKAIVLLTAICGIAGLVLLASVGRPKSERSNTAHLLGITNGLVGPMSTTYQAFSTNTAATIQKWFRDGTNAALLRVTNNQRCAIWLFPFARLQTKSKSSESILLDAPTFSGVRLLAGQATDVQIAIFAQNEAWRIEIGYTRERGGSFMDRLRHLPRDVRAFATRRGIMENTIPIQTEWIQP
jgi:hypothetical protein